jgi:hypothetical protein
MEKGTSRSFTYYFQMPLNEHGQVQGRRPKNGVLILKWSIATVTTLFQYGVTATLYSIICSMF